MEDQLRLITQADVFVGMHGAGLAHVLMLQKHAVMIELFPGYYCVENNHFAYLARYSGVSYLKWTNLDPLNERGNFSTVIPQMEMNRLLGTAVRHICGGGTEVETLRRPPLYVVNNYKGQEWHVPPPLVVRASRQAMCRKKFVSRNHVASADNRGYTKRRVTRNSSLTIGRSVSKT